MSKVHKCTERESEEEVGSFVLAVPRNGSALRLREVRRVVPRSGGERPKSKRGKVKGISRWSGMRLRESVGQIDRTQIKSQWFATLTVPAGECQTPELMKVLLRRWGGRVTRRWGSSVFWFWKIELHASGTWHAHLLLMWTGEAPDLAAFRGWNDRAWAGAVRSENPAHVRSGCQVNRVRSWAGVASYVSGYIAQGKREADLDVETGRIWGIGNRASMPIIIEQQILQREAGVKVRRVLAKLQARRREWWYVDQNGERQRLMGKDAWARAQQLKSAGLKVRRKRARVFRQSVSKVWREVEESDTYGRNEKRLELVGEEVESVVASLHFVESQYMSRLVAWAESEVYRRAREEIDLPGGFGLEGIRSCSSDPP